MAKPVDTLYRYNAPSWAQSLAWKPEHRLKLAMLPTPIQPWYDDLPGGFTLHIKRDDMTGCALTGSKVRSMEFSLAAALDEGCRHVIASAALQSNEGRTVAVLAAQLKLECHYFVEDLSKKALEKGNLEIKGNFLLSTLAGARFFPGDGMTNHFETVWDFKEQIENATGEKAYAIVPYPVNLHTVFGHIQGFAELVQQGVLENYDDVIVTCSSGPTSLGYAIGNHLTGSKVRIHAYVIGWSTKDEILDYFTTAMNNFGLCGVSIDNIVDLVFDHQRARPDQLDQKEFDLLRQISSETGVILDPQYTIKAVKGLFKDMKTKPSRFKGKRILFLHSGGVFALFGDAIKKHAENSGRIDNGIHLKTPSTR